MGTLASIGVAWRSARRLVDSRPLVRAAQLVGLVSFGLAAPAWAESEAPPDFRGSLQVRLGESNPLSDAHDVGGLSLGLVYGDYLAFELSMDSYELFLDDPRAGGDPSGKVAELSLLAFSPQVRVRYPLFDRRIEPYLLAGGGIAIAEVNDRAADVQLPGNKGKKPEAFGVLAVGIDYFFAQNAAVGIEGRYFLMGSQEYVVDGESGFADLDVWVATLNLRVMAPEGSNAAPVAEARKRSRFSFGLRTGGAHLLSAEIFDGIFASPEQPIFGTGFSQQFGAAIGFDYEDWLAIDLEFENYEFGLTADGVGKIGEYAVFPITLTPRIRLPGLPERLEASMFAGPGVEYAELNDMTPDVPYPFGGRDITVIGTMGASVDYLFASNASLGLRMKYIVSRGHRLEIDGIESERGNLDAFLISLGVKVFFGEV